MMDKKIKNNRIKYIFIHFKNQKIKIMSNQILII